MRCQRRPRVQLRGKREHFLDDVTFVLQMPVDSLLWRLLETVEAFRVDAVDAYDLQYPRLDLVPQRVHHPMLLILEKSLLARREDEQAGSGVAEDEQLHLPAQRRAFPLVV